MVIFRAALTALSRTKPLSPGSAMSKRYFLSLSKIMNRNSSFDKLNETNCLSLSRLRFNFTIYSIVAERNLTTNDIRFAKSKDRGKDKKKTTKVQVNLNELSELINVERLQNQMDRAVEELKNNFAKNLTLRSSIGSIEQVPVTWEGKEYKLQELSQIARKPKTLVINVAAFPQVIPSIIEAIAKSGMNLNPQQDGTTLFVPIPKVTKEHRENLAKNAKTLFIRCRDDVKNIEVGCIKSLKNKTDVSQDVIHNVQNQIHAIADKFVNEAESIFKMKQKELLGDSD